ncbi:MAG: rod shape-determining protein MreC [Candidatus Eisenbacteria bacterium]|uniref:Cell shape-determining protein MreC n=1 Tax=Eiseniibacteriota bacterium TaxID=2212470 RepID=A0A849SG78_UNCEI|nr:rod shape-determining protein MreC [Candidatus Eisenbacteria bacterium]
MAGILPPTERRTQWLLATYVLVSLLLLLVGERLPLSGLRGVGAWLFSPLDRVVLLGDRVASSWRENEALHMRLTQLELENARLKDAGIENRELREALRLPVSGTPTLRPTELIALSGEAVPASATLAAGARQGVHVGDVVVTHEGLVGRVIESWSNLSRAALLTDPNAPVAAEVESTGVLGIVHFTGAPAPRLLFTGVPFTDTVRIGQRVVTSQLSRRFPRGIRVGVIRRIGIDPSGLMQEIELTPAARMTRLRHVFVTAAPPALVADGPPVSPPVARPRRTAGETAR